MNDNQLPKWLIQIQNNSWEPEIIISGFSIAFFFVLPNYIYNFTAMLVQDFGADSLLAFILYSFLIIIITSLKVLFLGHIVLRGLWAGLVGLSYVFPEGIKNEKLEKDLKAVKFSKPMELVIKIEKICSLIFAFSFLVIIILIKTMCFYLIAIIGNIIFHLFDLNSAETQFAQLSYLGLAISAFFIYMTIKKNKLIENTASSISGNILYTFLTNISGKKIGLILASFLFIIIPLSFSRISKFKFDVQQNRAVVNGSLTLINQDNYMDERDNNMRMQRAAINSFDVRDEEIQVYISTYKKDDIVIQDIKNNFDKFSKLVPSINIEEVDHHNLYQLFIDDIFITTTDWILIKDINNSQKFISTTIPIDGFDSGLHTLKIRRVKWQKKEKDFVLIDSWSTIPFKND